MNLCRIFLPILLTFCAAPTFAAPSSEASSVQAPQPRLRGAIREGARATLPNSRPPRVLHGQDLGPVPDTEVVPGITLVFRRSAAQQADLQTLLADQQNPASPSFHH